MIANSLFQPPQNSAKYLAQLRQELTIKLSDNDPPIEIHPWLNWTMREFWEKSHDKEIDDIFVRLRAYAETHTDTDSRNKIIECLRKVAYIFFSLEKVPFCLGVWPKLCMVLPYVFILHNQGNFSRQSSATIIIDITRDAIRAWQGYLKFMYSGQLDQAPEQAVKRQVTSAAVNANAESICVSHGGGFLHLLSFLAGLSDGYGSAESSQTGIFVSIHSDFGHRDVEYACRTPIYFCDTPITLTAKTRPSSLVRVPNSYEALLVKNDLENVEFSRVRLDDTNLNFILGRVPAFLDGYTFEKEYPNVSDQPKRLALESLISDIEEKTTALRVRCGSPSW